MYISENNDYELNIQKKIKFVFNEIKNIKDEANIKNLSTIYQELIKIAFNFSCECECECGACDSCCGGFKSCCNLKKIKYGSIIYRMIFYIRDEINGIGNLQMAHVMLGEWIKFGFTSEGQDYALYSDMLSIIAFLSFIHHPDNSDEDLIESPHAAYGNWADIKYFCNYLRYKVLPSIVTIKEKCITDISVFNYIVKLVVAQLENDEKSTLPISLMCRSLPKEKSKNSKWLAKHFAFAYYPDWVSSSKNTISYKKSVKKCLTHYRKLVSRLNKTCAAAGASAAADVEFAEIVKILDHPRYKWANKEIKQLWIDDDVDISDIAEAEEEEEESEAKEEEAKEEAETKEEAKEEEEEEAKEEEEEEAKEEEEAEEEEEEEAEEEAKEEEEEAEEEIVEKPVNSGWFSWLGWN